MLPALLFSAILAAPAEDAASLLEGDIEKAAEGFQFTEGPVWHPEEGWLFSDIPADTIYRADKSVFRQPSGQSNGLTLDNDGRLIACEHWNRRVTRTEADGSITVLADAYQGKKLNSPNDVIVRSDGAIFFTDPPYGLAGREAELDFSGVFMIAGDGELKLLADDFVRPNGLALSPGESTLYIADTDRAHIRAFDIAPSGELTNDRVFCELPTPDGLKVDVEGRVWATASDGVHVLTSDGTRLDIIVFPQHPANCSFGEEDGRTFFVTARTAVYQVRTKTPGIHPSGAHHALPAPAESP